MFNSGSETDSPSAIARDKVSQTIGNTPLAQSIYLSRPTASKRPIDGRIGLLGWNSRHTQFEEGDVMSPTVSKDDAIQRRVVNEHLPVVVRTL